MKDGSQYVGSRVFNTVPVSECNIRRYSIQVRYRTGLGNIWIR